MSCDTGTTTCTTCDYYPVRSKRLMQTEVKVSMILTLEKHIHDHIISGAHKTSMTMPLCTEVPVPSQGSKRWCICVSSINFTPFSLFLLYFETLPTVCFPTLFAMSLILPFSKQNKWLIYRKCKLIIIKDLYSRTTLCKSFYSAAFAEFGEQLE